MKKASLLALSACLTINAASAQGDTSRLDSITTLNGQSFQRIEVLKRDPDGLLFRHAKGMAKIPFADLPAETQERFNYKPEEAAAFVKEHVEAEKEAKAKAAAARAQARERKAQEKALQWQLEWLRHQANLGYGQGDYIIPGYADFGVPTWGYGHGLGLDFDLDFLPPHRSAKNLAARKHQWDRDRLFQDFSTTKYIGPNAPLYSGAVTNTNVRPFSTFGGYRYPTELAVRAGHPLVVPHRQNVGFRPTVAPGHRPIVRPVPGPSARRYVPANSGGARIGGTGTLMQGGASRISHR